MLKISDAGCLGLSPMISLQFTLEMCQRLKLQKKSLKPLILRVQGHQCWHHGKHISSACYDKQQDCVYLQLFSH